MLAEGTYKARLRHHEKHNGLVKGTLDELCRYKISQVKKLRSFSVGSQAKNALPGCLQVLSGSHIQVGRYCDLYRQTLVSENEESFALNSQLVVNLVM